MRHKNGKVVTTILAVIGAVAALNITVPSASALPRQCVDDPASCPDPRDPPGGPTGPADPEPQPLPPAPYRNASAFTNSNFAQGAEAQITALLGVPPAATDPAWPLSDIPFHPEVPGDPVRIAYVGGNVWVFASYDHGGRPTSSPCVGHPPCWNAPEFVLNSNYGLYWATLRLRPRLDIEFWRVGYVQHPFPQPPTLEPERVWEVTATLDMVAFAECARWETNTATLHAQAFIAEVTIERDPGIVERLENFVVPVVSETVNRNIRARLEDAIGVRKLSAITGNGTRCYSLGVRGDAIDGAILWNEEPRGVFAR